MSFLLGINDTSLLDPDTKYRVWDEAGKRTLPVSLRLFERESRVRLEMSPVYFSPSYRKPLEVIFSKALQILADPRKIEPARPPGHVHAEHTRPTSRWNGEELRAALRYHYSESIGVFSGAVFREDEGSVYRRALIGGLEYILQEAKSSGRVLIGRVTEMSLPTEFGNEYEYDGLIMYKVLRRMVVKAGKDDEAKGRSKVGETNYDFLTFITG